MAIEKWLTLQKNHESNKWLQISQFRAKSSNKSQCTKLLNSLLLKIEHFRFCQNKLIESLVDLERTVKDAYDSDKTNDKQINTNETGEEFVFNLNSEKYEQCKFAILFLNSYFYIFSEIIDVVRKMYILFSPNGGNLYDEIRSKYEKENVREEWYKIFTGFRNSNAHSFAIEIKFDIDNNTLFFCIDNEDICCDNNEFIKYHNIFIDFSDYMRDSLLKFLKK